MRLDRVNIVNYRSIKNATIDFDPACRVLVGINESGKSNSLKALSFLNANSAPNKKNDLREKLPDEDQIKEASITFIFRLEKADSDKLNELVSAHILAATANPKLVSLEGTEYSLRQFCRTRKEGLYEADILNETTRFTYWDFGSQYNLLRGWRKVTSACPADFTIALQEQTYHLSKYTLVRAVDFPDIPETYLEDATFEDLASLVGDKIIQVTKQRIPKTVSWEYDDKNLLPNVVSVAEFAADPDTCTPLKHMFNLADINDIAESLTEARELSPNQFQNYLDHIAHLTTRHFRTVWKDYKNVEFSLRSNADQIVPGIKEKNTLDFERRSDGFKRFATFLLMISVNVRTKKLRDILLLIDEPDTSLHPSGARYLRDELISIAKTNYVVYSTHLIFMIDPGNINRHYIVRKTDEITSIETAESSNVADEEVLYNALGHSVFSVLKEKNIIFEGWKDKRLFQVALQRASSNLKKKYSNVGICHVKGVKMIRAMTPMMELAERECLIVSDSDKPAKEQQKLYKKEKGYGKWTNYQDIDSSIKAITGEDFITNDFMLKQIRAVLMDSAMPKFEDTVLPEDKGKLSAIRKWLIRMDMTEDQAGSTLTKIKDRIFEDLQPQHISDAYTKLLEGISL